jgi:hypothetical protein
VLSLEQRAKRRRDVLEKALDLVESFRYGAPEQAAQLQEIRNAEQGDPIEEILALYRERSEIMSSLHDRIDGWLQQEDLESALDVLDAVESLQSIAPSPEQQEIQQHLATRASENIREDGLGCVLKSVLFAAQIGEWQLADAVVRHALSGGASGNEFSQWRVQIDQQLACIAERDAHVERHLERLRRSDLDGAINELSSARDLDPENKVFSVSLASLLLQKAEMLECRPETDVESLELTDKAKALLPALQAEQPLRRAVSNLLGLPYEEEGLLENAFSVTVQQLANADTLGSDTPAGAGPITNVDPPPPEPPRPGEEVKPPPAQKRPETPTKIVTLWAGWRWTKRVIVTLVSVAFGLALMVLGTMQIAQRLRPFLTVESLGTAVSHAPSSSRNPVVELSSLEFRRPSSGADQKEWRRYAQALRQFALRFAGTPEGDQANLESTRSYFGVAVEGAERGESCEDWKKDLAAAKEAIAAVSSFSNEEIGDLQRRIEKAEATETPCTPHDVDARQRKAEADRLYNQALKPYLTGDCGHLQEATALAKKLANLYANDSRGEGLLMQIKTLQRDQNCNQ